MTSGETYMHGNRYEYFIRRAFNCDRGSHGAETSLFKFLLEYELGRDSLGQPYSKQLEQVKNYLEKAVDKFLQRKPTPTEKSELENLKLKINEADSSMELVDLLKKGMDITIRYRDL